VSRALEIYRGSDGEATKAFYVELEAHGDPGRLAVNLFRAQKCSERAKQYRGRANKSDAYDRKNWSLQNLAELLALRAEALGIQWGWGLDEKAVGFTHVLYIDLPQGQVSFHSAVRYQGPHYLGAWDGAVGASQMRVVQFADAALAGDYRVIEMTVLPPPVCGVRPGLAVPKGQPRCKLCQKTAPCDCDLAELDRKAKLEVNHRRWRQESLALGMPSTPSSHGRP
jgi:hypothetical protein